MPKSSKKITNARAAAMSGLVMLSVLGGVLERFVQQRVRRDRLLHNIGSDRYDVHHGHDGNAVNRRHQLG